MDFSTQHVSFAELVGTLTGLIAVWLTVKENRWCFPVGIVSSAIYAVVFFRPDIRFYGDAALQVVYVVLLLYGWITWTAGKQNSDNMPVTRFTSRQLGIVACILIAAALATGIIFDKYTDASMPYVDALTTTLSLAAQWMIAKKKIENWHLWIVANIVYLYMYVQKDLYITAFFYFALLILAFSGLREWKKHLAKAPL